MSPNDIRPRTLYFVFAVGCGHCEESMPVFEAFARANPLLMALRVNAAAMNSHSLPVRVKATPTWIYRIGNQVTAYEGAMTTEELTKWIAEIEAALAIGDPT